MKDDLFKYASNGTFKFDDQVSSVFDDMVTRSVPAYENVIEQMSLLAQHFYRPNTAVYDMGCSTANMLLKLIEKGIPAEDLIGVDESKPMIDIAREKLQGHNVKLVRESFQNLSFQTSSVFVLSLFYQFIRPAYRELLISKIYEALVPGGAVLLFEKILPESDVLNELYEKQYYDFKESNGYSKFEIKNKRKKLEYSLIPNKPSELHFTFRNFQLSEVFFQQFNFQALIAVK